MRNTYIKVAVGASFLGAFLVAVPAQAASLTQAQTQAVVQLLQSFGVDQTTIANVETTLGASADTAPAPASCLSLYNNLYLDQTDATTNGEVSKLQQFLGGKMTGYFGPATEQLVQNWQSSHSVISSGSPDTTGFGYVGPRTRGALGCGASSTNGGGASGTTYVLPSPVPGGNYMQSGTSSPASATIDPSSLIAVSPTPTLTGTASNTDHISGTIYDGATTIPLYASVTNGVWTFAVPSNFPLQNGTYTVNIYSDVAKFIVGTTTPIITHQLLTTGTLTINTPAAAIPTATIDPSSLTTASSNIILTGTAANLNIVHIKVKNTGTSYGFTASNGGVINGKWSAPVGYLPQGSYPVEVYSLTSQPPLAVGTLVVTASNAAPTATIDQSSLTSSSGNPMITGTATGITYPLTIMLQGASTPTRAFNATVTNGTWSTTVTGAPLPSGTYTVQVLNPYGTYFAKSTLTITQ